MGLAGKFSSFFGFGSYIFVIDATVGDGRYVCGTGFPEKSYG
jgi:hypothetical protein